MRNKYTWVFTKKAEKEFNKLDKTVQQRIIKWLNKNIECSTNPRFYGKPLEGELGHYYSYRVGSYRILADIHDDKFIVVIVKTDKRSQVYRIKR
jgi:mRNA interferase RelE/StbE